eukprot:7277758-Pyramimonas_sp.AAC.1
MRSHVHPRGPRPAVEEGTAQDAREDDPEVRAKRPRGTGAMDRSSSSAFGPRQDCECDRANNGRALNFEQDGAGHSRDESGQAYAALT